jgi:IclR family transcriptional regulator, pca regulon regulatory protein
MPRQQRRQRQERQGQPQESPFFDKVRTGALESRDGSRLRGKELGGDYIQSLERGLAAIRAFTGDRSALSVSEVAERTGVSRAAARRILYTLECLGYVGVAESGLYRLEPTVLTLGYAYISGQDLPELARPYMQQVAGELNGSSSIGVLTGTDVTFIARVRAPGYLNTSLAVGSRLPAHLTAMGRVLLADLPDARIDDYFDRAPTPEAFTDHTVTDPKQLRTAILQARDTGYSLVDQELVTGVRALAVAIRDRTGTAQAGLNVAVAETRKSERDFLQTHLPVVRRAAESISSALASIAD